MKKVFVLSAVLGLSALGMACGGTATNNANNTNAVKPANTATPAPTVAAVSPATTTNVAPATNATNSANSSTMKPANAMTPAANATKDTAPANSTTKPVNK